MSADSVLFSTSREKMVHSEANEQELISSTISEDSQTPLSETVTTLASNVYRELERIIKNFGENSVKDLMPVMISTLESLDNALHEREVNKLEMDSLKEQNDQLFQQYEREKSFHKEYQQRYLQVEDHLEEIKRENEEKLQSLESIVKIFEIKARNASDHVGRLEDKEHEMKQEYKRLHDRYCELFKAHCDYMERTKILYGTDRLDQLTARSPSRGNLQVPTGARSSEEKQSPVPEPLADDVASNRSDVSLTPQQQFQPEAPAAEAIHTQTESMASNDAAVNTDDDKSYLEKYKRGIFCKLRSLNLLAKPFDEQQFFVTEDEFEQTNHSTDMAISDDDDDISVDDTKNLDAFDKETRNDNIDISDVDASADLFGMTKEVSNLIKENNELLETKNALNVLKDDLLVKIEELSNEQEILREEVESLQTVKGRMQSRNVELEDELRKVREELEKKKEEETPLMLSKGTQTSTHHQQASQDAPSSKVEPSDTMETSATSKSLWRMFSEDWLPTTIVPSNILGVPVADIQSDLREGTTQISEFFSGLFGSNVREPSPRRTLPAKHHASSDQIAPTATDHESRTTNQSSSPRHESEDSARVQLHGWSVASKDQARSSIVDGKSSVNVPMPIYCRPLFDINENTQVWCAVGIDLSGLSPDADETSVDQINKQLIESYHQMIDEQCLKLSSLFWIAAKSKDMATVTIIDSNKPERIIETFTLGQAIIYAIGSVPGTSSTDYPALDEAKLNETTQGSDVKISLCTPASLTTGGNRSNTAEATEQVLPDSSASPVDGSKTKYPTVWLGSSDGWLYIHSSVGEHRTSIGKVWLRHAIYSIIHTRGRVFVTLANEKIVVFHRKTDGTWDLNNFHLIVTGKSRESVRCAISVGETVWCGIANRVYVIHTETLAIQKQFEVHSRPEHSVQHMAWSGDGVWLSIRLSSTLQLYHARTFQHLQDVEVQPYVEKMLVSDKNGPCFVHISALTMSCRRLWIGTGNGIIVSVPLTDTATSTSNLTSTKPGSAIRVSDAAATSSFIPFCSMTNAQLSFHGYRDAVKFFVAVPGQTPSKSLIHEETTLEPTTTASSSPFGDVLVVSGGDGYVDFRLENASESVNRNVSHIIMWHLGSA